MAGLAEAGVSVYWPAQHEGSPSREHRTGPGGLPAAQVDEVISALDGPGIPELAPGMITAWGRRPLLRP